LRVTLFPPEAEIVRATLAFANHWPPAPALAEHLGHSPPTYHRAGRPRLRTVAQVWALLQQHAPSHRLAFVGPMALKTVLELPPPTPATLMAPDPTPAPSETLASVTATLTMVQTWLTHIAAHGPAARARFAEDRSLAVALLGATMRLTTDARGVHPVWEFDGLRAFFAFGVALVLDATRGLTARLGQCGYCGRFNLTLRGAPRRHCTNEHRRRYDAGRVAERVRAWRQRQQEQHRRGSR
jgi:hypothetical protein